MFLIYYIQEYERIASDNGSSSYNLMVGKKYDSSQPQYIESGFN